MVLEIETQQVEPDITVIKFTGKISLGRESQRIESMVIDLLTQNQKKIVFDLAGVDYVDSTGVGIIAYSSATVREAGGNLHVAGAGGKVAYVLKTTRLDSILPCYPSVQAATEGFKAHG